MLGVTSLLLAAYLSDLTGIGDEAREVVLATQTTFWAIGMLLAVALAGRATVRDLSPVSGRVGGATFLGTLLAVGVAYAVTAVVRGGGVLDADELGPAILIPASLIFLTSSNLGDSLAAPLSIRRPWQIATIVASVLTVALAIVSLWSYSSVGLLALFLAVAAYALAAPAVNRFQAGRAAR